MTRLPLLLIGLTVLAYWARVARMARKAKRRTGNAGNFFPPEPLGRALRVLWVPVVGVWITLPMAGAVARDLPVLLTPVVATPPPLVWGMSAVVVACAAATVACWRRMGKSWRMGINPAERTGLVCTGPYAHVAHPIYALSIAMMAATMAALPSPLMLAAGAVHVTLIVWEAVREERHLTGLHGNTYAEYRSRVGRFLPRVRRRR